MDKFTDGIKKIFLAGVGAVAVTSEKSQEVLADLVKKGELTVEQGKALNEELRHNIKTKVYGTPEERVNKFVKGLSEEEMELLKAKLAEDGEEAGAACAAEQTGTESGIEAEADGEE